MISLDKYQSAWIPLKDINAQNTDFQFRKNMNTEQLAESLKNEGQKFPVVLWRRDDGWELHLISGFRRFNAAKSLDWEKILAVIVPENELSREEALKLNFIENIERKSLTDLDLEYACKKLHDQGKSNREIARLIGKDESSVRTYLKIANAPKEIQEAIVQGKISKKSVSKLLSGKGVRGGSAPAGKDEADVAVNNDNQAVEELKKALNNHNYSEYINNMMAGMQGLMAELSSLPKSSKKAKKQESTTGEIVPNERMYVKQVKGGFDLVLKFRSSKDSIEKAIEFLNRNINKLRQLK
ncbi:MAG: ParB/RepB/Spo0J family partition protein [Endomicrobiales bacterium]|nr:ParB/RepB/Spo0J family partition protein [Endomicrobiales bacterium]